ncbi:MAG: Alpha/beta hydrolase domain, partial [Acetobacteraceae bacterium]|nr:Alpha/beta hydrolase domain [Acetobacteraceae bacterium]
TDPRASLAARYPGATYADAVRAVTQALLRDRLLLPEDAERYMRAT